MPTRPPLHFARITPVLDYSEEIDAEISQNDAEADAACRAWQAQRRLLS